MYKLPLVLLLLIALGFNQGNLFLGLYTSNVAVLIFIFFNAIGIALFSLVNKRIDILPLLLMLICLIIFYASFGFLFEEERFLPEYIKLSINLIFMYFMAVYLISSQLSILFLISVFVIGVVISTWPIFDFMATGGGVSLANRFNPIEHGGFNAYGAMLSLSIFSSVHLAIKGKKLKLIVFWSLISLYLFPILLMTMSRGGLLALLGSILFYTYKEANFKVLFFIVFFLITIFILGPSIGLDSPIINRFFNLDTVRDGSGRLQVYSAALNQFFSTPVSFLFGDTIGQFRTEVIGGSTTIQSLHSVWLFLLVSFGVLVTLIILTPLMYLFYITLSKSYQNNAFLSGVCVQIIIFMSFDNQFQGLQTGWVFYFWIAVLLYSYNNYKKHKILP